MTDYDISVVVPTYNNASALPELMKALAAQTVDLERWELIVVDDCSSDQSWETIRVLAKHGPLPFRALRTASNSGGPALPRNLGWRSSSADVIAFLDDDCVPQPGWLAAGLETMLGDSKLGVVQGCTRPATDVELVGIDRSCVYRLIEEPSPWFEALNIFYRRAALEDAGGFNEAFETWCEDTDLGWRVLESGWTRGFAYDATVVHEVERRPWRWWVRIGWKGRNMVTVVAAHPELRRQAFWQPWAQHREDAAFAAALVGGLAGLKWKPAALLTLPYLWWRRPSVRAGRFVGQGVEIVLADLARFAGHIAGSLENRTLVL